MSFEPFAEKCRGKLKRKQDRFQKAYDIEAADHWYYQQAVALLKLSWGETSRYFRYAQAGTFSEKTGTWLRAWDNSAILEPAKRESFLVRQFGEEKGFAKLTEPYFESSERQAWDLLAVSFDLLQGIGIYRLKNDHLHTFLVVLNEVGFDDGEALMANIVDCPAHDRLRAAYVCSHVLEGSQPGFEEAFTTEPGMWLDAGDDLQAWCNCCETARAAADGWNDELMKMVQIRLVCETCYFNFKERELGVR